MAENIFWGDVLSLELLLKTNKYKGESQTSIKAYSIKKVVVLSLFVDKNSVF